VVFVCNRRCLNGYGAIDLPSEIVSGSDTFHQHTVQPRIEVE